MAEYIYPHLAKARAVAKRLKLPKPYSSQRNGKKLYVVYHDKEIHFGARLYSDWLDHKDPERRARYRKRARGVMLSNGKPAYKDRTHPAFYAYYILW